MESLIIKEAVRTFKQIVGRHVYADSNLNALIEDVAKEDRAAPDVLNESDIKPGAPCAKFEDASLLVWKQWHSGGIGDAGRYTFHLYYHLFILLQKLGSDLLTANMRLMNIVEASHLIQSMLLEAISENVKCSMPE